MTVGFGRTPPNLTMHKEMNPLWRKYVVDGERDDAFYHKIRSTACQDFLQGFDRKQ